MFKLEVKRKCERKPTSFYNVILSTYLPFSMRISGITLKQVWNLLIGNQRNSEMKSNVSLWIHVKRDCQEPRARRKKTLHQNRWWEWPKREAKAKKDKDLRKEFNQELQRAVGRDEKQHYKQRKTRKIFQNISRKRFQPWINMLKDSMERQKLFQRKSKRNGRTLLKFGTVKLLTPNMS